MKKIFCLILSFVAVLSLTACSAGINYTKDDLGKYIELSAEDYKSFARDPDFNKPTDAEINRQIMNLLYKNRADKAEYNGGNVTNLPISVGDTVWLYYRGYTLGEDGRQYDIDGACNFFIGLSSLGIGSLEFVPGFEESLIGINPKDYERFELIDSGSVAEGDIVYLSYEAILPNGTTKSVEKERIDLLNSDIDSLYGEGFKASIIGAKIGDVLNTFTLKYGTGTAVYYDVKAEGVTRCERNPLTIEAHFPENYSEPSLQGANVNFDVYVRYINIYETPVYNDGFIKDVLKVSEKELSRFEGDSLAEKYRALIEYELTENAFWELMAKKVTVKKLPEKEVERTYEEYYYEAQSMYYSEHYSSLAEFAALYYTVPTGTDWLDYIRAKAEAVVTEKLMFYYIARAEDLLPVGETYDKLYSDVIAEYLEYYTEKIYKSELDKITDRAEKEKRLLEIEEEMLEYYGEEYFREIVYYDYALPRILGEYN